MKLTFRWYGDSDPVTLEKISQIPTMSGIVSAVYSVPVGEVWSEESIFDIKSKAEAHGLEFEVIESVPVLLIEQRLFVKEPQLKSLSLKFPFLYTLKQEKASLNPLFLLSILLIALVQMSNTTVF